MSVASEASPEAPPKGVRLIIAAAAATLLLAAMGQTIVAPALPTIVGELGGVEHLTWVVTAFLLSSTVVAPIYGKLGDLYGRKIVLQTAITIFLAGAALSASATSMTFLIVARAVQGVGGGGLVVVAMAVVADVIPPRQRGKIQGILGTIFGVSAVVGPMLGGFIVEHFSWPWIFLINLPLGILALTVISLAFHSSPERLTHKIDYAGFVLLSAGLCSFVLATSLGGTTFPWGSAQIIGLIVLAILLIVLFAFNEARAAEPVLPLSLFRNNSFVVSNGVAFLAGSTMMGTITFLPLFLQTAKGVTPTNSALHLLPMVLGIISASTLSGFIMSRTGRYRLLPILSTAVLVFGLLLLSQMGLETPAWKISVYAFLVGIGVGPVNSVGMTAIQNAAPRKMIGVATAGATMFRHIGGALGVSMFGAIFSSSLAGRFSGLPGGEDGSIMNPRVVAALPKVTRAEVLEGFASALHPVFLAATAIAVLAFILTFFLKELPLANSLRTEPQAEAKAEGDAASAIAGAPATPNP